MAEIVRVNLHLSPASAGVMDRLATERGLTRAALIRQALGVMQAMHDATREGLLVGATPHRENLQTVFVSPL